MSEEWFVPDLALPVRQGDLLIRRDPDKGCIEEVCLVITADCDISQDKFGRQLACLRILSQEEYLRTIWPIKKFRDAVDTATSEIQNKINKWNSILIQDESNMSSDAIIAWVRSAEPEEICTSLKIPEKEAKKVRARLSLFKTAIAVLNDESIKDKLTQLVYFRAAMEREEVQACWQKTLENARNEKRKDDVFLLPSLPDLDEFGPAVVLLREIVGVEFGSIFSRTSEASSNEMYLRIGRLNDPFKYGVAQAFGVLYSRIGFSEVYERRCKDAVNKITEIAWE